jgi:hypothetical protein
MSENLEKFGFTRVEYNLIFKKFNEPYGFEGFAREELVIKAIQKGWIRLRNRVNHGFVCELWEYNESAKANILNWVEKVIIKPTPSIVNKFLELEVHELSKFNIETQESQWKTKVKFFL